MKNVLLRAVSISFLAAILMFGSSMMISEAAPPPPPPAPSQVVMFTCTGDTGGGIVVTAVSSVGSVTVGVGSSCSQTLQAVRAAGFNIVESTFSSGSFGFRLEK